MDYIRRVLTQESAQQHDDLLDLAEPLLSLGFEQLRTLVVVRRTGSARTAALELGREQSSVQKQLDKLNERFEDLCGQMLVAKGQRGEDNIFTPTGETVVEWAEELLRSWAVKIDQERSKVGSNIRIATTAFTLPILGRLWGPFLERLDKQITAVFEQVRTSEFQQKLGRRYIDLALAGVAATDGKPEVPDGFVFQPWGFDRIGVLTNLPLDEMPGKATADMLSAHSLILPASGFVREVAERIGLNTRPAVQISDVYYGINALRYGVVRGSMLVVSSVGEWAKSGAQAPPDAPTAATLRSMELAADPAILTVVSGLFGRAEDQQLSPRHPISTFWEVYRQAVANRSAASPEQPI